MAPGLSSFKEKLDSFRKGFIILAMLVIGLLLLAYKLNVEYWQDSFGTYTSMVTGISIVLAIIGLLFMFMEMKKFLRHEALGFIVLIISAVIFLLYPGAPVLNIEISSGTIFIALGLVFMIIAGIILARSGGYFVPCLVGLAFQIVFTGYYSMMSPDATLFHPNAIIVSNIGIGFLIMSFILMVYQDLKFYYLTGLIKEANRLRKEKKYEEALKYCDKALKIYPYFVTALNNKGNILFNLKKPKEAIEHYNKAIDINPDYKEAQTNLEVVERKMGRAISQ